VKQAGFLVLYKTTMPSVLIETGFLTHSTEHAMLSSSTGQTEVAQTIFTAFREFKNVMESSASSKNEPISKPMASKDPAVMSSAANSGVLQNPDVFFTVQIATATKPLSTTSEKFRKAPDVWMDKAGSIYKFLSGRYISLDEALNAQAALRNAGFAGAFVTGYRGKQRITVAETQSLIKNN
jgi:N-acetylmuramoyl-L-alanine amidase